MTTVQTNVRVLPNDKPLIRSIAARLRVEPRFRERLRALIEEDPTPALQERIERLEEQVGWLLSGPGQTHPPFRANPLPPPGVRLPPNGGSAS
jgi:hypothetical protein